MARWRSDCVPAVILLQELSRMVGLLMDDDGTKAMYVVSEPTIDEMLADPIVRLLMARDCVGEADLRRLIRAVSCQLTIAPSRSQPLTWSPYRRHLWVGGHRALHSNL